MMHEVTRHALALGTVMVEASAGKTELQIYEHENGGVFALDGSYLEQVVGDPAYIGDPFNEGCAVQLIDTMGEKSNLKVIGEDHPDSVIDEVIVAMKDDISKGDWTAIAELLHFLPSNAINNYLG